MGLADLIASGMDTADATALLMNVMWTMIGAILVYFMQAGFAMCEAGFTRAKNTGNILMKNMMDFVLGSIFFFIFGFALMHGTDWNGIVGIKGFFDPTSLADADGMINGRANKICSISGIQCSNQYFHLPNHRSLDLGRWLVVRTRFP